MIAAAITLAGVGEIATVVIAAATVGLLVAALVAGKTAQAQIAEQRAIASRGRAYDHLGVFNSKDFTETSSEAERVFGRFKDEGVDGKTIWTNVSEDEKVAVLSGSPRTPAHSWRRRTNPLPRLLGRITTQLTLLATNGSGDISEKSAGTVRCQSRSGLLRGAASSVGRIETTIRPSCVLAPLGPALASRTREFSESH